MGRPQSSADVSAPLLEATGLRKRFGPVTALEGVDFACAAGEVHALLGENGAGKSTLASLITGLVRPDGGEMRWRGESAVWRSAGQARGEGISMVHQHFMLVPTLSIAENVALARRDLGLLDRERLHAEVRTLAAERRVDIGDPSRRIEDLAVGEQQRVEILKALVVPPALLVLDEPTAVLVPSEVRDLFSLLRSLVDGGTAIVIVTHKLAEVEALADRVTVLRRGRLVGTGPASDFDASALARLMVGERTRTSVAGGDAAARAGAVVLEARGLSWTDRSGGRRLDDVSLAVREGEILVVAGVEGNGQSELAAALAGERAEGLEGEVKLCGRSIASPAEARAAGLAVVPADRRRDGLVSELALWENLLLARDRIESAAPRGWLRPSEQRASARASLEEFHVRPADPDLPAAALSGGNQQRLVLARELSREGLRAVVAATPTRGLDLVATEGVHDRIRGLARGGAAVLVFSTDLDEVEALADRILVLFRGRIVVPEAARPERAVVGRLMAGVAA